MKRVNWVLVLLILIGFVIGGFIGTYFEGTFLNYGQNFGLQQPHCSGFGLFYPDFRAFDSYYHRQCDWRGDFTGCLSFYPVKPGGMRRRR